MICDVEIQVETQAAFIPEAADFERWVSLALMKHSSSSATELVIRVVDEEEGLALNEQFRGKAYATNVLSFPVELPEGLAEMMQDMALPLGDLVICASVVVNEARAQNKQEIAHWAHLTLHGVLHLLGYDHINDDDAEEMEGLEIALMADLGYENPYQSIA